MHTGQNVNLSPLIRENPSDLSLILDYGQNRPTHYPFDIYQAYALRIDSFIKGALYALEQMPSSVDNDKKIKELQESYQSKMQDLKQFKKATAGMPADFSAELEHFFYDKLPQASGLDPKELSLAEAFYVWQKVDRPKRVCRQVRDLGQRGKIIIEQVDTPRHAKLTAAQKLELIRIHTIYKPDWFFELPSWAQTLLLKIVPQEDQEGTWTEYEKCRPATLRHIPGEANATTHQLNITHVDSEGRILRTFATSAERQGVPTSYNMKNKNERQTSADQNLKQMLDEKLPQQKANFEAAWGFNPVSLNIEIPVLLGGLVTPANQAGIIAKLMDWSKASGDQNNTVLAREKTQAVANYAAHPQFKVQTRTIDTFPKASTQYILSSKIDRAKYALFDLNVPVNANLSIPVAPSKDFIQTVENFCRLAEPQVLRQMQNGAESKETIERRLNHLQILKSIAAQLTVLSSQKIKGRNRNLYLASLYDIATRLMGGLSTGNCKSSKDRKSTEFIIAAAILVYCAEQLALGKSCGIPAFTDKGAARKHYVEIVCEVYASGHHFLLSHDNSDGSLGLKDEGLLDEDIVEKLQSMRYPGSPINLKQSKPGKNDFHGVFGQSKQAAKSNKPGSFWRQHSGKIKRYAFIGTFLIFTLLALGLTFSSVLSPIGIIGLAAAANLGSAAIPLGLLTNVSIFAVSGIVTTFAVCKTKDLMEQQRNTENRFISQIERFKSKRKSSSTTTIYSSGYAPSNQASEPLLPESKSSEINRSDVIVLPQPQADEISPDEESSCCHCFRF